MATKRKIDRLRESGGRMEIGIGDDQSDITDMFKIRDTLHIIKAGGIYEVLWPDVIDPDRTNLNLPPTQSRILAYGSDDEFVAQVLLTAKSLFAGKVLQHVIDPDHAIGLALVCLKNLLAMREMCAEFQGVQEQAEATAKEQRSGTGTLALPSLPDLEARVTGMIQKASHAVLAMKEIARLFYGTSISKNWVDSLSVVSKSRYGEDCSFSQFLRAVTPILLLVVNLRNAIEHPQAGAMVQIRGFMIDKDGVIWRPSLEVVHDRTPLDRVDISIFIGDLANNLALIAEGLFAHFAACNLKNETFGVDVGVATIPPSKRKFQNVKFGYAIQMGGEIVPFSVT